MPAKGSRLGYTDEELEQTIKDESARYALEERVARLKARKPDPTIKAQVDMAEMVSKFVYGAMENQQISIQRLSKNTGITQDRLREILGGSGCHTEELAVLAMVFGYTIVFAYAKFD